MTAVLRVVESNARRYRHTWRASVFSTFLNPVLLLLAMGVGLGTLVDRGQGAVTGDDLSYLAFLAPGLLAANAMQTAAGESSYPVMAGIKWLKTFVAAIATPVSTTDVLLGGIIWTLVRALMGAFVFAGVEIALGAVSLAGGLAAVAPAVVTALAFATNVTWYTVRLESETGLANLFRFGILPLFLFSGTFFPISQLPDWMEPLAILTPLWHGVEWARSWALGLESTWPWWGHALFLFGVAAFGFAGARRAFHRKLIT